MTERLRVGVVGAGLIAQVMHLHYLAELDDRFEVAAVCDVAEDHVKAIAGRHGIPAVFTDWRDLLAAPLDAVLVLTSGSHAPVAVAAARAGLHVFTEKPMCFSVAEGREMVEAAERAGVILMVGYPKRYDPAYERFKQEVGKLSGARMMRVTTFESPLRPYVGHYPLLPPASLPAGLAARLRADADARVAAALGDADEAHRRVYHDVLLDTLVHELNAVRGVLGEPDRLEYADLAGQQVTVVLRFGGLPVVICWIDLPGIAAYAMEFAVYAPQRRITLSFPSPFLRSAPATLLIDGGEDGAARSWRTRELTSYESGFKRELAAFHQAIVTGTRPATAGSDGLADVALCQAIIECHRSGRPADHPSRAG